MAVDDEQFISTAAQCARTAVQRVGQSMVL
jgi:hypothetical protein